MKIFTSMHQGRSHENLLSRLGQWLFCQSFQTFIRSPIEALLEINDLIENRVLCSVTKSELQRLLRKADLLSRETRNSAENKHGFFIYNSSCNYQKSGSSQADWAGNGANQRWNVHWSPLRNQLVPRLTHKMLPASPSAHNAAFNKKGLVFRSA